MADGTDENAAVDKRVSVTLQFPADLLARLDGEARRRILHRGVVVRLVIEQWLDDQEAARG